MFANTGLALGVFGSTGNLEISPHKQVDLQLGNGRRSTRNLCGSRF